MALARSDLLAEEKKKLSKMNVVSLSKNVTEDDPSKAKEAEKKGPASAAALPPTASASRNDASIVGFASEEKKEEISLVLTGTPVRALATEIAEPIAVITTPMAAPAAAVAVKDALPPAAPKGSGIRAASQSATPAAAAAAPAVAAASSAAAVPIPHPPTQKFQLIGALLQQNAYLHAERLMTHMQSVNPAATAHVGMALADFAGRMLRPLYAPISSEYRRFARPAAAATAASAAAADASPALLSPAADFTHSVNALPPSSDPMSPFFAWTLLTDAQVEEQFAGAAAGTANAPSLETYYAALPALLRVLKRLGVYLCNDAMLWSKLCRVVSWMLRTEKSRRGPVPVVSAPAVLSSFAFSPVLEDLVADTLLPAFSLMPSSHGSSEELWCVLKQLPFELRYRLYGHWQTAVYSSCPELQQAKASVLHRARYFRKRIAAAKVKECSRLILKFCENNPLLVLDLLLQQIQSFDNMIGPVTDAIKLLHPLAFDATAFVLLTQVSSSRTKLSDDGVNESRWLQSLAQFGGTLWKKYPEVELAPLLLYVLGQLKADAPESHDLLLLKDLIVHMTNIEIHEDVTEAEMEGRAGGLLLRTETTTVRDKQKNKAKPTKVLVDTIIKYQLTLPLFVAIAQLKSSVISTACDRPRCCLRFSFFAFSLSFFSLQAFE